MSVWLLVDCPLPCVLVRPQCCGQASACRELKGGGYVVYCIVETLSSYLFTCLTSIGCFSGLCYVHSIGNASPVRFSTALQAKFSSPGSGARIHAFPWPRRRSVPICYHRPARITSFVSTKWGNYRSQIREDNGKPSVSAWEINLMAHAPEFISGPSPGIEPWMVSSDQSGRILWLNRLSNRSRCYIDKCYFCAELWYMKLVYCHFPRIVTCSIEFCFQVICESFILFIFCLFIRKTFRWPGLTYINYRNSTLKQKREY